MTTMWKRLRTTNHRTPGRTSAAILVVGSLMLSGATPAWAKDPLDRCVTTVDGQATQVTAKYLAVYKKCADTLEKCKSKNGKQFDKCIAAAHMKQCGPHVLNDFDPTSKLGKVDDAYSRNIHRTCEPVLNTHSYDELLQALRDRSTTFQAS